MARILKSSISHDYHRLTIWYVAKVFYQTRGPWGPKLLSLEHDIILLCLVSSIKINKSLHGSCLIPVCLVIPKWDPSIVLVKASERTLLGFNSGNNTVSGQRGMPKPNWRQWKQSAEMPTRAKRELGARPDHTWTSPFLPFDVIQPLPPVSFAMLLFSSFCWFARKCFCLLL